MLNKSVRKYLANPYYGLIPFLLYLVLINMTGNVLNSLVISFLFSALVGFMLRIFTKTSKMSFGFFLNQISFAITLLFWILLRNKLHNPHLYTLMLEVSTIVLIMILRIPFVTSSIKSKLIGETPLQKVFIYEFIGTLTSVQYLFTFHVFVAAFYELVRNDFFNTSLGDTIVYFLIPIVAIVLLIGLENFKLRRIIRKLRKEEWLPIVNEKGEVKGKIARSVSVKMKSRFLHPVVRVALVCKGNVYLQRRGAEQVVGPRTFDHPFEKYILFDNQIDVAAKNSIVRVIKEELPVQFLIKYTFKTDITNRLIYLFVARVEDESSIEYNSGLSGRFWNQEEIEKGMKETPGIFCELFHQEYDYLKNIVLSADLLIQKLK